MFGALDASRFIAGVLVAAAEDLHAGSNLRAITDGGPSEDTVAPYVHAGADSGGGMCEEGTKLDAAGQRAFGQRELIKSDPQIVARNAGGTGVHLRKDGVQRFPPPEPCHSRSRENSRQRKSLE